jgi:hypothetical protein
MGDAPSYDIISVIDSLSHRRSKTHLRMAGDQPARYINGANTRTVA